MQEVLRDCWIPLAVQIQRSVECGPCHQAFKQSEKKKKLANKETNLAERQSHEHEPHKSY